MPFLTTISDLRRVRNDCLKGLPQRSDRNGEIARLPPGQSAHAPTLLGAGGAIIRLGTLRVPEAMSVQRPTTIRHRTSLFQEAVAIVESEYATELALDEIARRIASSRRQLQRAYAEIGRTTFREHVTRVRMERAAELLGTRRLTIREVAFRVGYRQPAQFAKAFRRHHGLSPSDFRTFRPVRGLESARSAA
jgi:AraC family transcriptional regulator, regulatory protein of adaptative response / methylphosphotriester-DNA alkyltransferase methyltransferase